MSTEGELVSVVFLIVGLVLLFVGGLLIGRSIERSDGLRSGAAEWRIDPQTGNTSFVYKPCGEVTK